MNILLKDAVDMYGSDACKSHFAKRNRFTSVDVEAALIKTMKQHYGVVEKIKIGRYVYFNLENKKEVVSPREDKRVQNGKWSTPYTEEIDLMLLIWITVNGGLGMNYSSISTIARESKINSLAQEQIIASLFLKKESTYEEDDFFEYFHCEGNNYLKQDLREQFSIFNRHVKNSIERLDKKQLLFSDSRLVAKMLHPDNYIHLKRETEESIKEIKKNISSDLGLSIWMGESSFYKKEAIEYRQKSHKEIEQLILQKEDLNENRRLEFIYMGYMLLATEGTGSIESHPVFRYLNDISKKYNLELFQNFDESIRLLSEKINKLRIDFIKSNLTKKYEFIKNGLSEDIGSYSPMYDPDFGDQSGFKKKKRDYRKEYHQMIYSGYIHELVDQMMYTFYNSRPFAQQDFEVTVC